MREPKRVDAKMVIGVMLIFVAVEVALLSPWLFEIAPSTSAPGRFGDIRLPAGVWPEPSGR